MIELENVCKSFILGGETIKALDNVNFKAKKIVKIADGKLYEGEVI